MSKCPKKCLKIFYPTYVCKNSNLSYLQRQDSLNLEPLEIRLTYDLVFMYKYLNGFINTNLGLYTCIQSSHNVNLRGNCKKLFKMLNRLHNTGNFFAYRTINVLEFT